MSSTINPKGALALLGAAALYASFGLLVRLMAPMFSNNAQVAFRFTVAAIILGVMALVWKRPKSITRAQLWKIIWLSITFSGVVLLYTMSAMLTKLGNAVLLLYAGSIITSLIIGTSVFKERLTSIKVVAIVLSLIGLAMYSSAIVAMSLGVVAAIGSGVLDGVGNAIRKTLKGIDRNTILFYQYAMSAAITLSVLAAAPADAIKTVSAGPIVAGLLFAVLIIGLGNLLLYGFQHFDVNVGTVILATELFFALIIGWVFFAEEPAPNELVGGVVIFAASILSAVDFRALYNRGRQIGTKS